MTILTRFAAALVSALVLSTAAHAQTYESVGRIDNLVPAAFHTPPGGQQLAARQLDPVVRDETLTTTDEGGLLVTFADGSELTLGANSTAVIDEFAYPGPGQGNATIELVSGVFRFVSGQMDEAGVKVETPTASIGIRGTVIYVVVLKDGTTIQITDRGAASVYSKKTGKTAIVEEETGVSVDPAGELSIPVSFSEGVDQSEFQNPELLLGLVPTDAQEGYPNEIALLPSISRTTPPSNRKYNLAKPGEIVVDNAQTGGRPYLAAYFMWDGTNGRPVSNADIARARAVANLTRRTSEIGSAIGSATGAVRPRDRINDGIVGVFTSTTPLAETPWTVTTGTASIHFREGATFGSIGPQVPGAPIVSLNNSGVPETVMVKTFTLGPGDRVFDISGFANFITAEFPRYVGQFNDTATVILRTPGGQELDLSELFSASVDGSDFTPTPGLPLPQNGQRPTDGGQTGWRAFFSKLRVAPGGTVTIEVRVRNARDVALPSGVLLNGVVGTGGR